MIGKREAEPSVAAAAYVYSPYVYAYRPFGASYQSVATPAAAYGIHQLHKREAEPQGIAVHPGLATSSTYRSVQGASAYYGYPYAYTYPYTYGYAAAYGHYLAKREAEPQGIAVHPGLATSSTYRSVQGAAAAYYAYPYTYGYPYYGLF